MSQKIFEPLVYNTSVLHRFTYQTSFKDPEAGMQYQFAVKKTCFLSVRFRVSLHVFMKVLGNQFLSEML
jgi:hypothetical protein